MEQMGQGNCDTWVNLKDLEMEDWGCNIFAHPVMGLFLCHLQGHLLTRITY